MWLWELSYVPLSIRAPHQFMTASRARDLIRKAMTRKPSKNGGAVRCGANKYISSDGVPLYYRYRSFVVHRFVALDGSDALSSSYSCIFLFSVMPLLFFRFYHRKLHFYVIQPITIYMCCSF